MKRSMFLLVPFLLGAAAAQDGGWVAKVPDFRSAWPEPLAPGTPGPDFSLEDAAGGPPLRLSKARAGKRATLLLFLDEKCSTCRKRGADLAASLDRCRKVEGTLVAAVFTRNLSGGGAKAVKSFAEEFRFPAVPLLRDEKDGRAEATLAYRVPVSPCAAVLDAAGRMAYFGLALENAGADLLPGILATVASGKAPGGPATRPPYG